MTESKRPAVHFQLFAPSVGGPVRWRLLSGNNREIGRAVAASADPEECRVQIKELLVVLDDLLPHTRRVAPHEWVWELRQLNAPLATGHRFDRQIRCEQAMRSFLISAPEASISEAVMVSGSRRWTPHSVSGPIRSSPPTRLRSS